MTYTYAILVVSKATFDEIRGKLQQAGYPTAWDDPIDLHGIAISSPARKPIQGVTPTLTVLDDVIPEDQ